MSWGVEAEGTKKQTNEQRSCSDDNRFKDSHEDLLDDDDCSLSISPLCTCDMDSDAENLESKRGHSALGPGYPTNSLANG